MGERYLKLNIDGTELWMETEQDAVTEQVPKKVSNEEMAQKTLHTAEAIADSIRAYCTSLVKSFKDVEPERIPDKVTAEFGIKLSGEGNVYVVKSTAEASLKVTAEWLLKR